MMVSDRPKVESYQGVMVVRDDLYVAPGGARGGKARTCEAILRAGDTSAPVVTAGSRSSPQVSIVARTAFALGYHEVRVHTPSGEPGSEVVDAVGSGATRITHSPGYNTVLIARAAADARDTGAVHVPFGMETPVAVEQTAGAALGVATCLRAASRIVVPVGSGMSLAGILTALADAAITTPVVGVVVGADPRKRLERYAPPTWRFMDVDLVPAGCDYAQKVAASIGPVMLDPVYEAKCARFLADGDLLWCVGIRRDADR